MGFFGDLAYYTFGQQKETDKGELFLAVLGLIMIVVMGLGMHYGQEKEIREWEKAQNKELCELINQQETK
jgi:hypothetical protein